MEEGVRQTRRIIAKDKKMYDEKRDKEDVDTEEKNEEKIMKTRMNGIRR
jgi:hypothetical protein